MRAISPILSAVILLLATLAAGAIMYHYFINTVQVMTKKPIVYGYNAEYMADLGVIYVTIDNSGSQPVTLLNATLFCDDANNKQVGVTLNGPTIKAGETRTVEISSQCKSPRVLIISYKAGDKIYTTDPIRISVS